MASSSPNRSEEPKRSSGQSTGVIQVLNRLRNGDLAASEVSMQERRACVAYLRLEGYTQEEVAEVFGVSRQTVVRDERANRKETAKLVSDLDVRAVAGGLIRLAGHLRTKALKEKDYGLAWRIERELVGDLQGLGYLPKAAEQHNVHIATFADLAKLAVQDRSATHPRRFEAQRALPAPKRPKRPRHKREDEG